MKKMKKIFFVTINFLLLFAFTSCSSTSATSTKEESTSEQIEQDTTKFEITNETETEVKTETETEAETEILFIREEDVYPGDEYIMYLLDKKDFIIENFDGKEFHYGEVYNCAEELQALGCDLDEYGNAYVWIYNSILFSAKFEIMEITQEEIFGNAIVDSSHNLIIKNTKKEPFKVNVEYIEKEDRTTLRATFTSIKE